MPSASPAASPATNGLQLYVSATDVQFDEAFGIGVRGLDPGDDVTIRSDFTDERGRRWSAEATYLTGDPGFVDCSIQAPYDGSFDVADSMAFIWAATSPSPYYAPTLFGPEQVTITASVGNSEIGSVEIERAILPGPDTSESIYSADFVAQFHEPAPGSPVPAPAVVVLGGSEGGISTQLVAGLLASHGYATLAVGYFNIGSLPATFERIPLEYFANAIFWLQNQPDVDATRLGVLGFSRGGELALLLGAYYPEFTAVVSYVGSGYSGAAYDPAIPDAADPQSAWTWDGEPLPVIPFDRAPTPAELAAAEIPVERTNGPILLISGGADALWPSTPLSRAAWDRLQRTEHPWPDQFLAFPGAGHGIYAPYGAMTFDRTALGGDPWSDQVASVTSWQAMLAMFDWRLKCGG